MSSAEWDNREDPLLLNGIRLMHHITEKGFQVGSIAGLAIFVPIVAYRQHKSAGTLRGSSERLLRVLASSAIWGAGVSTMIGAARVAQLGRTLTPEEFSDGMQDRAYRLHYNRGQRRVDFFAEGGMAVGGTVALLGVSPAAAVVLGGAAAGAAAGVLAHVATSPDLWKKKE